MATGPMNRFVAYFVRFAVIFFGYAVGSLAASAFIHVIFFAWAGVQPQDAPWVATGSFVFSVPFVALFVAYFGFMPSALAILMAELLSRRDWLYYALAGGAVAAVFIGYLYREGDPDFAITDTNMMLSLVGAGMIGGIFYWLAAGQWAGSWKRRRPAGAPSAPGPSGS